jgi:hypothetical protein
VWSRNKANLYIQDALADFHPNPKALPSPPRQHTMYKQKLMLTHLTGFGAGKPAPVTTLSYYFADSTGEYLTIPDHADWSLSSGDFALEMFIRYGSNPINNNVIYDHVDATPQKSFKWVYSGDNNIYFFYSTDGTNWATYPIFSWTPSTDTWYHVALARDSTNLRCFIDGTQIGSTYDISTDSINDSTSVLRIAQAAASEGPSNSWYDEMRISNVNRSYTTTFSPPTAEFTSDANTKLLIHCNEAIASGTTGSGATFVDSGNTGHTVTEIGSAIRSSAQYKF